MKSHGLPRPLAGEGRDLRQLAAVVHHLALHLVLRGALPGLGSEPALAGDRLGHCGQSFGERPALPSAEGEDSQAHLASLLAGIAYNERRGDAHRAELYRLTKLAVDGLRKLGFFVDNDRLIEASKMLFDAGVLLTLGPTR